MSQGASHFLDFEHFQLIAFLHIVEVFQGQAAFEAGFHFSHIVLETLERIEFAGPYHDIVAQQAYRRTASDQTVEYIAAGNGTDFADQNDLADFDQAQYLFAFFRRQHAGHRRLDLIHGIVDDIVVTDIDAVGFGQLARGRIGTGIETDDDRFGRKRKVDIRFADAADGRMHDLHAHFTGGQLLHGMHQCLLRTLYHGRFTERKDQDLAFGHLLERR